MAGDDEADGDWDRLLGEGMYGGNGMKEILIMKIIFLDIDGVLQPYDNEERFQHDL